MAILAGFTAYSRGIGVTGILIGAAAIGAVVTGRPAGEITDVMKVGAAGMVCLIMEM